MIIDVLYIILMGTMINNRAKILLDRINNEFGLVTLKEDTTNLLSKASLCTVLEELGRQSSSKESKILIEAIKKLKEIQ